MNHTANRNRLLAALLGVLTLTSCSLPTLVQVARTRQATDEDRQYIHDYKDDPRVQYSITDWDVLNFSDEVKRKLSGGSSFYMNVRYASAGTQATLGALAGAAKTIGWGTATASGLGLGATYIFGMGQIFDAKGHSAAYEQAYTLIQAAEATYYFHELGMGFDSSKHVDLSKAQARSGIPSTTMLTPDGETLYYRVTKILKVLNDTLESKIPDLEDLKSANGEQTNAGAPAVSGTSAPVKSDTAGTGTSAQASPTPATVVATATPVPQLTPQPQANDSTVLQNYWSPNGAPDPGRTIAFNNWLKTNAGGVDITTFLYGADPSYPTLRAQARATLVTQ